MVAFSVAKYYNNGGCIPRHSLYQKFHTCAAPSETVRIYIVAYRDMLHAVHMSLFADGR
eukprot:m.1255777 g.1255777  ORF g.1255777 m.1255777 type:complete len:59 (+) comp24710_c1_seq31:2639-2815(+)